MPPSADSRVSDLSGLLHPTLQEHTGAAGRRPWGLRAQFWVAFLGGVVPATVMAYLNGVRLGLSDRKLRDLLLLGALAFVGLSVVAVALTRLDLPAEWARNHRAFRLLERAGALLLFLAFRQLQKGADRLHSFWVGEYDSPWRVGLLAVFVAGTLQDLLLTALRLWAAGALGP